MTLLELLVVISILMTLLGLSASAYLRISKRFKDQGAAADLEVVLRQARNAAIAANAPAFVELDPPHHRVVPWHYQTVGLWHFEKADVYGRSTGAYHEAVLRGAKIFKYGKIGGCVWVGSQNNVDLGVYPDYDFEDGGYLEAYIRFPAGYTFTGEDYIFYKKNSYYLKLSLGGLLAGNAGNGDIKSSGYRICAGRWFKVAFAWDRNDTRLLVDDAAVGRSGLGSKPPVTVNPLLLGHDAAGLMGWVDEVRVMAAVPGNPLDLPPEFTLQHNVAPWNAIYFAADGTLDMHYHAGPASVTLLGYSKKRTVTVSMLGMTTRLEVEVVEQSAK